MWRSLLSVEGLSLAVCVTFAIGREPNRSAACKASFAVSREPNLAECDVLGQDRWCGEGWWGGKRVAAGLPHFARTRAWEDLSESVWWAILLQTVHRLSFGSTLTFTGFCISFLCGSCYVGTFSDLSAQSTLLRGEGEEVSAKPHAPDVAVDCWSPTRPE